MGPPRNDRLQVPEHVRFTWHFGTLQRIGWGLMALVIMAALAGFSGAGGPASRVTVGLADVPTVMRVGRPDHVTIYRQTATGTVSDPSLGPLAGEWLDVGSTTQAGPNGDRLVVSVTPRQSGVARLRVATGPDMAADVTVLILP